jgi:AhpD family alkylhydroperoxidase
MHRTLAHSPAALRMIMCMNHAISRSKISETLRAQISLAVAGVNSSDYCAAYHLQEALEIGLDEDEAEMNLDGDASSPLSQAAIDFARSIVLREGYVSDGELRRIRMAGFDDQEVVELIMLAMLNMMTNYFNQVAETALDTPPGSTTAPGSAAVPESETFIRKLRDLSPTPGLRCA